MRESDSALLFGAFDEMTSTAHRLKNDAAAFRQIAKTIRHQLPLRTPMDLKEDQKNMASLLTKVNVMMPQNDSLKAQFEKMMREISHFTSTLWNLKK